MTDLSPIAQQVWDMKYRLKAADGTAVDKSIEDSWRRIAGALATAESGGAAANRACNGNCTVERE